MSDKKKKRSILPTDDPTEELRQAFRLIDQNGDGAISAGELQNLMIKLNFSMTLHRARKVVEKIDKKGLGVIKESDFIEYMLSKRGNEKDDLRNAFHMMDTSKTGYLSKEELRTGLKKMGVEYSDAEFSEVLKVIDKNNDGHISWEEFIEAMD